MPVLSTSDPTWFYIGNKRGLFDPEYPRSVFPDEEIVERKMILLRRKKSGAL